MWTQIFLCGFNPDSDSCGRGLNIWSISNFSTLDTVEFKGNNIILLRKVNFAFMIPNPSLDCYCALLNFWPNLSLVVLIRLFVYTSTQ